MNPTTYYETTAFDSSNPVAQKTAPELESLSFVEKSAKAHALSGRGLQCREYTAVQDMDVVSVLNNNSLSDIAETDPLGQEETTWRGYKNPRVKVEVITMLAAIVAVIGGSGSVLLGFIIDFDETWLYTVLIWLVFPFFIYKLGKTALKKNWVKDNHNTLINRRTGLVTFTWKRKRVSYPFAEFDPTLQSIVGRSGLVSYHLVLMHRYTGQFCREPGGEYDQWKVELYWEELQHFMDISKPLPDVPKFEAFRHKDPVTKAWDETNQRPKDYWKSIYTGKAEKMKEKSVQHAQHFPFGKTREQAISLGWQPSGIGEGWQPKLTSD
ncbi:MAG: hypothetical protein ACC657_17035 [Thiohalomonadales bacterium]